MITMSTSSLPSLSPYILLSYLSSVTIVKLKILTNTKSFALPHSHQEHIQRIFREARTVLLVNNVASGGGAELHGPVIRGCSIMLNNSSRSMAHEGISTVISNPGVLEQFTVYKLRDHADERGNWHPNNFEEALIVGSSHDSSRDKDYGPAERTRTKRYFQRETEREKARSLTKHGHSHYHDHDHGEEYDEQEP